eukprot:3934252-Pleurochrysis_carterae.AAC.6
MQWLALRARSVSWCMRLEDDTLEVFSRCVGHCCSLSVFSAVLSSEPAQPNNSAGSAMHCGERVASSHR